MMIVSGWAENGAYAHQRNGSALSIQLRGFCVCLSVSRTLFEFTIRKQWCVRCHSFSIDVDSAVHCPAGWLCALQANQMMSNRLYELSHSDHNRLLSVQFVFQGIVKKFFWFFVFCTLNWINLCKLQPIALILPEYEETSDFIISDFGFGDQG